MAKAIRVIELSGGIILSKTDLTGELLFRANKKTIFLDKKNPEDAKDEYYWVIRMSDNECFWDWFDGHISERSQTGNRAYYRRGEGNIIKLAPCIKALVETSATMSPEEFLPTIEESGEAKIVQELEKIAVLY